MHPEIVFGGVAGKSLEFLYKVCLIVEAGFIAKLGERTRFGILLKEILQADNRSELFRRGPHCRAESLFQRALASMQLLNKVFYTDIPLAFVDQGNGGKGKLVRLTLGHPANKEFLQPRYPFGIRWGFDELLFETEELRTKHEVFQGNALPEDFVQGLAEEGCGPGFFKKNQDRAGARKVPKAAVMIGKPRNAGSIERDRVAIVDSKKPALVLKADDNTGVRKDLVRRLLCHLLDGKRPDKRLEGI